jgi:hypothetical protein
LILAQGMEAGVPAQEVNNAAALVDLNGETSGR